MSPTNLQSAVCIKTILRLNPLIIAGILWPYPVASQVIPDQTLGVNQSTVTPANVNGISIDRVDGGVSLGKKLFHSFQEFNIPVGKEVYFSNPNGINAILARVTGQNISNINGKLGVLGNSDLFLLNPNGIIFGGNARLDINGSFLASTAQNLISSNGSRFGNSNFQDIPNTDFEIVGLEFSQTSGKIAVKGNGYNLTSPGLNNFSPLNRNGNPLGLRVKQSKTLGLFANEIEFDGGIVAANSGSIDIGSVSQGTIDLQKTQSRWLSNFNSIEFYSDINLSNNSLLENLGSGNQSITLTGKNIEINSGSLALIETNDSIQPLNQPLDNKIQIKATDLVSIDEVSNKDFLIPSGLRTDNSGSNRGSDIFISARDLNVSNGGRITTFAYNAGAGGNIEINVRRNINLESFSKNPLAANSGNSLIGTSTTLLGKSGDLSIKAENLRIIDSASLALSNFNVGEAGNISLDINNRIALNGTLRVISPGGDFTPVNSSISTITFGSKPSGNISIQTNSLYVEGGSILATLSIGSGDSGNIYIDATEFVEVNGFQPSSKLSSFIVSSSLATGNSGTIRINTKNLSLLDGGVIAVSSFGSGRVGFIDIKAKDSIAVFGSSSPINSSGIRATSTALDPALSDIFNFSNNGPSGQSFGINIITNSLLVRDGGNISVQNDGPNDAGDLTIQANKIEIDNASIIGNSALGNGGDISLKANLLSLNNGNISSSANGRGIGGNVNINSDLVVAFGKSSISANAQNAQGGRITFNTLGFFPSPQTEITATSDLGTQFDGTISFNNPDTDLELETAAVEVEPSKAEISSICRPSSTDSFSEFIASGEGGVPTQVRDSLNGTTGWHDASGGNDQTDSASILNPYIKQIDDAQGWITNPNGTMSLVATANTPITKAKNPSNCNAQNPSDRLTTALPLSTSIRTDTPLPKRP